jgi:diguanylate cyclase (GGDEF)-like protein
MDRKNMWKLTIRSPKSKPVDHILKQGVSTMGRKSSNDIIVLDESASRIHAEIECHDDQVIIQDLGSTNGTFVNQKRLSEPLRIISGDQIRIGYHLATLSKKDEGIRTDDETGPTSSQPLTPQFLLESYEQNAVLIFEVSNRLTTVLDLNKALMEISEFLSVAIGANKCEVLLADQFDKLQELGFSASIAQQAIEQCSVIIYPDPNNPKSPSQSAQFLNIHSALCIPILNEKETVALVYIYKTDPNTRPFDQNDIYLAVAGSHQAALAIQRAQIVENAQRLEEWAFTDSLTGLDNRRQILHKGAIECSRSNRFRHPLTVIMIDIDEFKHVNDTYGHLIGDQIIRSVADRLKTQLRDVDLIGRLGGDEFLLFLVETEVDQGVIAGERLLRAISESPAKTDRGPVNISISMGITYIKKDYADVNLLIKRADDALISAKRMGKNNFEVLL